MRTCAPVASTVARAGPQTQRPVVLAQQKQLWVINTQTRIDGHKHTRMLMRTDGERRSSCSRPEGQNIDSCEFLWRKGWRDGCWTEALRGGERERDEAESDGNRVNFCKRKLFELFLLSQSREHPELRSALELLSGVTATMSQLLWMFRTPLISRRCSPISLSLDVNAAACICSTPVTTPTKIAPFLYKRTKRILHC